VSAHPRAVARLAPGPRALLLALALAAVALGLASRTAFRDSCTVDEFGNLPLTVAFWRGALHIDPGNPPLTRWIQGIPLLAADPDLGAGPAELAVIETSWDLGYRFEGAHRNDYHALLTRARLGSLALLVATVLGVFLWARKLAGDGPAFAAGLLAATSPDLVAHGRLVTPDIGLAAFVVWTAFAVDRAARRPGPGLAGAAGALAGLACLAKFSGLLVLAAGPVALALAPGTGRERSARVVAFVLAALVVVFAGYGFAAPGRVGSVPLPLPAPMLAGLATQLAEPPYPAYLLGELREDGGWWYYYVVAFLVKTPIAALGLFLAAALVTLRHRLRPLLWPLALAALFLVALGLGTKKNIGLRYLLPVLPLLHVTTVAVFRGRMVPAAGALALIAALTGILSSSTPLAYLNPIGRLLSRERPVLVDSNLDWGQALPDLRDWQRNEGIEIVQLAYFGRIDPTIYGVTWRTLRSEPVKGAVAISATLAVGRPYSVRMKERPFSEPELAWSGRDSWAWLAGIPPDEVLGGGSILVWRDMESAIARRDAGGPP